MAPEPLRKTKIVATVGPASESPDRLRELFIAGVDVVRLNFSHGDHQEKSRTIGNVRRVAADLQRPVAILQDLQGPKIRVGLMEGGSVELVKGSHVSIRREDGQPGTSQAFSVSLAGLAAMLKPGDHIYLDDGLLELSVVGASQEVVEAEVVRGGILGSHKGVNLPGATLNVPSLTEKDAADLRFGLAQGVDLVALSFVRQPEDAEVVRRIMSDVGRSVPLIAKIEKPEALAHLDSIIAHFDGVMVARGDLGVELPPEKVPAAQKRIISRSRLLGRPVITATQMLESMTQNPRPTRAEASDVANAVLDGTDAVMLSGETAVGAYPVEAVQAMDRIVREAEAIPVMHPLEARPTRTDAQAVCDAAVRLAEDIRATALTALTRSGKTAQTLSGLHPSVPILAFLWNDEALARALNLWRGVVPLTVKAEPGRQDPIEVIRRELLSRNLVQTGSQVVVVGAAPGEPAGRTNLIQVLRV